MVFKFSWFDVSVAKQFGTALAMFYLGKLPLDVDKTDKKYQNKKEFVLKKMSEQVTDFRQAHQLNIYKKAQLGNAFKWALRDAGYPDETVDELTGTLMRQL